MLQQRWITVIAGVVCLLLWLPEAGAQRDPRDPRVSGKTGPGAKRRTKGKVKKRAVPKKRKPGVKKPPAPKPSRSKLPPFSVSVSQLGKAPYLYQIGLVIKLLPAVKSPSARGAINSRNKMAITIDNKMVGETHSQGPVTKFFVSTKDTTRYNFRPGRHRVRVDVFHDGQVINGTAWISVDRGSANIEEISSHKIYFSYSGPAGKHPRTCHVFGDRIAVAAKVTDHYHPSVPVKGLPVVFRCRAKDICAAKTNHQGIARCSFTVSLQTLLHYERRDKNLRTPFVRDGYYWRMPDNAMYRQAEDRFKIRMRSLCACPAGQKYNPADAMCH